MGLSDTERCVNASRQSVVRRPRAGLYIWSELRGYSASITPIRDPELFKCAIGFVGIYDLPVLYEKGDVSDRDSGVAFVKTVVGTDEAELKKI